MTPVLGITGMPGSGKSAAAAALFSSRGVLVDADRIGHQVLEDGNVKTGLVAAFGAGILEGGRISRPALAQKAFSSREGALALDAVCHPAIRDRVETAISPPLPGGRYYVLEAVLLFEAGFQDLCDLTVFIDAPFDLRYRRVFKSRGWSEAELRRRDLAQDEDLKRLKSDLLVDGNAPLEAVTGKFLEIELALLEVRLKMSGRSGFATSVVRFLRKERSWVLKEKR